MENDSYICTGCILTEATMKHKTDSIHSSNASTWNYELHNLDVHPKKINYGNPEKWHVMFQVLLLHGLEFILPQLDMSHQQI